MAVLLTTPSLQFLDDNGDPLSGGMVYSYDAGTTTPKATYTDQGGLTEHTNPIVLDAAGRPPGDSIWLAGSYKIVVTDENDVQISSTDDITAFTATAEAADAYFESFSGTGSQTAFSLSEDLGTEEKAINVYVDAGGGKGYEILAPTAYTVNGTTLTFVSAPASGTNNIYVWAPSTLVAEASASAAAADASATAAGVSATNAATSETNAATSETNAAASATAAAASATAAATSATNAATSETNAATSETNAASSASAAATSATNAATSESNASTSETNASTSATAAASSATAAAGSATTAATEATNAATSATNAATSETNAGTSETNAAASAAAAAASAASLNIESPTANGLGSLLVQNGTDDGYELLGQGTSTYVLTSNGPDALPTWQASSGGGDAWGDAIDTDETFDADSTHSRGTDSVRGLNLYYDNVYGTSVYVGRRIYRDGQTGTNIDLTSNTIELETVNSERIKTTSTILEVNRNHENYDVSFGADAAGVDWLFYDAGLRTITFDDSDFYIENDAGNNIVGIDHSEGTIDFGDVFFEFTIDNPIVEDGAILFNPESKFNGYNFYDIRAEWTDTKGTGAVTTVQVRNVTSGQDVLSTALTIDSDEWTSDSAATAAVIDTAEDDITTNDQFAIDIDTIGSTVAGVGLKIKLYARNK